jgi:hypothetical protein
MLERVRRAGFLDSSWQTRWQAIIDAGAGHNPAMRSALA